MALRSIRVKIGLFLTGTGGKIFWKSSKWYVSISGWFDHLNIVLKKVSLQRLLVHLSVPVKVHMENTDSYMTPSPK